MKRIKRLTIALLGVDEKYDLKMLQSSMLVLQQAGKNLLRVVKDKSGIFDIDE